MYLVIAVTMQQSQILTMCPMAKLETVFRLGNCFLKIVPASEELREKRAEWSEILLEVIGGKTYCLGSDNKSRVVKNLIKSLTREIDKPAGIIDGLPYICVFSLTTGHTTLYASENRNCRYLHFEDLHGKKIHQSILNSTDIQSLLTKLQDESTIGSKQ